MFSTQIPQADDAAVNEQRPDSAQQPPKKHVIVVEVPEDELEMYNRSRMRRLMR